MKIVIIGGGSYKALAIVRGAMNIPGVLDGGEVNLFDLNVARAETVGRILLKTPEFRRARTKITWGTTLEQALEGADAVGAILPALTHKQSYYSTEACARHGFISSDNVSPTGSFCAISIAPVVMNIARKMEQYCPNAWFLDFVNPVAVFSGMVNNHTRIRALGVCGGYTNHLADISRLTGVDEDATDLDVAVAGVNHISYITGGTWKGRDLFEIIREHVTPDWKMPKLNDWWSAGSVGGITNSVTRMVRFWRDLGVLVFSTEGDGMDHLMYDEAVESFQKNFKPMSEAELDAEIARKALVRQTEDASFQAYVDQDLNDAFWAEHWKVDHRLRYSNDDIFVRIFTAIAGVREIKMATSRPNLGAVAGIKDRHVVEYSQYLFKDQIRAAGKFEIPDVVHGISAGLANYQTMLGDALATQDPRLLAHALLAYPMAPFSQRARALNRDLIAVNSEKMSPALRAAADFL